MQHWKAMTRIDELIMIIPVILNLKGNLEMNLSARLGTSANMGDLDIPAKRRSIVLGNLTFLQVQATVVSFFAACVAFLMSKVLPGEASTNGEGSSNGAEGELVMPVPSLQRPVSMCAGGIGPPISMDLRTTAPPERRPKGSP